MGTILPLALILLASTISHISAEAQGTSSPVPLHRLLLSEKQAFISSNALGDEHFTASGIKERNVLCDHTYGLLPCSSTLIGNLFLLMIYGYFMYKSATMLSEGSELLLIVLDPGIVGGLLLPIVGVLPDTILVAVSGLGGSKAEAQEQVLVGIGLLAGSNVMLLTLLWGTCLILGRCDFEHDSNGLLKAKDKTLTRKFGLSGTGVETNNVTKVSARIMSLTVIPFIVAELPIIFRFSARSNICVLLACVISLGGAIASCSYQAVGSKFHKMWALKRHWKQYVLCSFQQLIDPNDRLVDMEGNVNKIAMKQIFDKIDTNKDGRLIPDEVRVALVFLELNDQLPECVVSNFMKYFDKDRSNGISLNEFEEGLRKWCKDAKLKKGLHERGYVSEKFMEQFHEIEEEEKEEYEPLSRQKTIWKASGLLIGGAIMAVFFADPLVDSVTGFSRASHIPPFFLSFVLLPFASNASEGISSIIFASRKRKMNMSMTYSQIYGGVTLNNTLSLGVFLAIVYGRHLVWEFTSEVLIIAIVTIIMGLLTSIRKTFPLWMAFLILPLYPLSLALVAVLDYIVGWE